MKGPYILIGFLAERVNVTLPATILIYSKKATKKIPLTLFAINS